MQQPSSFSSFNASVSPDLSGLLRPYRVNQAQDLPFFCPLHIDRFDIAAAGSGSQRAVVSGLITKASISTIETSLRGGSYLAVGVHTYAVTNTADDGRGGSREDNAGNSNINASTSTSVGGGVGGGVDSSLNPYKIGSPAFVVRPSMGATTMALAFISLLIFVVTAPTIFAISTFRRMPLRGAKGLRSEMESRQSNQGGVGGAAPPTEMEDVDGEKGGGDEAEGIGVDIRYAPLYMTLVQILHTTIIASTAVLRPVAPVASLGVSATAALVYVSLCLF
jgi:hypothetical protein